MYNVIDYNVKEAIMKRFFAISAMMLLALCMLCGCGNNYDAKESTVFVLKNGKVVSTDVEQFSTDTYNEEELKKYIDSAIDEYNTINGKNSVKLKKLSVEDNVAKLSLIYEDVNDYSKFNGIELFSGTIAEALAQGYSFSEDFAKIDGDKITECDSDEINSLSGYNVAVIKNNVNLNVYGEIKYATIKNTKLVDGKTLSIKEGNSLLQNAVGNTENSIEMASETEESTQMVEESNEGSVGEDELLTGDTSSEEVFDFSDDPSLDTDYTDVYTYVIFK